MAMELESPIIPPKIIMNRVNQKPIINFEKKYEKIMRRLKIGLNFIMPVSKKLRYVRVMPKVKAGR